MRMLAIRLARFVCCSRVLAVRHLVCALYLVSTACVCAGAPAGTDIYAHFVGDWSGTDRYSKSGTFITEPLSLHVTELPKNKGISLKYTYGDGVQYKIEHLTRVITLDPARHKMTSQSHAFEKDTFEAMGLERFAENGLGNFHVEWTKLEGGVPVMYVGEYRLSENEFSWTWERAERGQALMPYGEFHLQRTGGNVPGNKP